MSDKPVLSIAIVNWNTREMLRDALRSIYEAPPPFAFEVVVVDNASHDGSAAMVVSEFPQVLLVANTANTGYAEGNNQAIAKLSGAFVLLLNPDVILPVGGLETAVRFMESHKDAGALGVRQVYPDGTLQRSVRGFPTPLAMVWELLGLSRLFPNSATFGAYRMTYFTYDRVAEVDQPMGTFLLMRREVIDKIGALDEAFPIFFNEVDWCLRCKRAGWKIFYTPDVQVIHYGGASTVQVGAAMAWESRRGLLKFYTKHYSAPMYLPIRALIALASYPHAWLTAKKRDNRKTNL